MRKIIYVIRLKHDLDLSHKKTAKACDLSKGAVGNFLSLVAAEGIGWPLPQGMDKARLEARLFPTEPRVKRFVEPDYFQAHQELKCKGVTLRLLFSECVAVYEARAHRYTQFCQHYRQWQLRIRHVLVLLLLPGEFVTVYLRPTANTVRR